MFSLQQICNGVGKPERSFAHNFRYLYESYLLSGGQPVLLMPCSETVDSTDDVFGCDCQIMQYIVAPNLLV